jgi:hypothetical protein
MPWLDEARAASRADRTLPGREDTASSPSRYVRWLPPIPTPSSPWNSSNLLRSRSFLRTCQSHLLGRILPTMATDSAPGMAPGSAMEMGMERATGSARETVTDSARETARA